MIKKLLDRLENDLTLELSRRASWEIDEIKELFKVCASRSLIELMTDSSEIKARDPRESFRQQLMQFLEEMIFFFENSIQGENDILSKQRMREFKGFLMDVQGAMKLMDESKTFKTKED